MIHGYDVLISLKELKAEYPNSFFFKDTLQSIVEGNGSFTGNALRQFKIQCENYVSDRWYLFRIKLNREMENHHYYHVGLPNLLIQNV